MIAIGVCFINNFVKCVQCVKISLLDNLNLYVYEQMNVQQLTKNSLLGISLCGLVEARIKKKNLRKKNDSLIYVKRETMGFITGKSNLCLIMEEEVSGVEIDIPDVVDLMGISNTEQCILYMSKAILSNSMRLYCIVCTLYLDLFFCTFLVTLFSQEMCDVPAGYFHRP